MNYVIALIRHETNTFSPVDTHFEDFRRGTSDDGPIFGQEALEVTRKTSSAAAAFIKYAQAQGVETRFAIAANASPSGVVTKAAFDRIVDIVLDAIDEQTQLVMLDLHGAMVASGVDDAEGVLAQKVRQKVGPNVPIIGAFDFHSHISARMVKAFDVMTGYRTYPHIDVYETGERALEALTYAQSQRIETTLLWTRLPMLTHMLKQSPDLYPMKNIMDAVKAAEGKNGIISANVFGGFPLADIAEVGFSFVFVVDKEKIDQAKKVMDELAEQAWALRADFVLDIEPIEHSLQRAKQSTQKPVLLVDHGDNCGAGGPTDNMYVLAQLIEQGFSNVLAGSFADKTAVEYLKQFKVGDEVDLLLGGKVHTPAMEVDTVSIQTKAKILQFTDGRFTVTGPMFTGMELSLGDSVVIELPNHIIVVVATYPQEPYDTGVLTHTGLNMQDFDYVLIKSRQHFRAAFASCVGEVILVAGPGVCSSDYSLFSYQHLPSSMYPLDLETAYESRVKNY